MQKAIIASCIAFFPTILNAQETPEGLVSPWLQAIKTHSIDQLKPLIHPSCSKENIQTKILERMVDGDLPPEITTSTIELNKKDQLAKVYEVIPDMQLNLEFVTHTKEDRAKYGIGKGFPIALYNSKWYFVVCIKPN